MEKPVDLTQSALNASVSSDKSQTYGGIETAGTLQDLADRLGSLLGNPITIEATDFELIAYSRQEAAVDEVRKLTILQRRVPEQVVRALFRSGIVGQITSSSQPVRVSGLERVGLGNRVAVAIRLGERVFGHIWVQEVHRVLTDEDMLLLQHSAHLATAEFLRMEQQRQTHAQLVSDYLWELVTASQIDQAEALRRAERLQILLPESYRIVLIDLDGQPAQQSGNGTGVELGLSKARQDLTAVINDEALRYRIPILYVRQGSNLVLLAGTSTGWEGPEASDDHFARAVRNLAQRKRYAVSVAASGVYTSIGMLPKAYAEAVRCLQVGRQLGWTGFVANRGNLGALQFLPLLRESFGEEAYTAGIHAKIARLIEEDQRQSRNFPLMETLEVYLDCAGDAQRAAEKLFVHVNTLNYRLRRIVECTGLQLSDGLERLSIHMELKLRRLGGAARGPEASNRPVSRGQT